MRAGLESKGLKRGLFFFPYFFYEAMDKHKIVRFLRIIYSFSNCILATKLGGLAKHNIKNTLRLTDGPFQQIGKIFS